MNWHLVRPRGWKRGVLCVLGTSVIFLGVSCQFAEDPNNDQRIVVNPYGFRSADIEAMEVVLGAAHDALGLLTRGRVYEFGQSDVAYAVEQLALERERRDVLHYMYTTHDYRNLGLFMPDTSQIREGLDYWGAEMAYLEERDVPYWEEQRELAIASGSADWNALCRHFLESLVLRAEWITGVMDGLERDYMQQQAQFETAAEIVWRKLNVQEAAVAYYTDLVDVLSEAIDFGAPSVAEIAFLIASPSEVVAGIEYWTGERGRIAGEEKPFWEQELCDALSSDNAEWGAFCEHMLSSAALLDTLAGRTVIDLGLDGALPDSISMELKQEIMTRKQGLMELKIRYYEGRIEVLREGMSVGRLR